LHIIVYYVSIIIVYIFICYVIQCYGSEEYENIKWMFNLVLCFKKLIFVREVVKTIFILSDAKNNCLIPVTKWQTQFFSPE